MAYWGKKLKYTYEPQETIKPGDGVNTFKTPFEIKKSELVSGLNISNRNYPALSVRPGMASQYGTSTTAITTPNATGVRNGTTFHVQDGTTWKYWNGSSFTNVATGLTSAEGKFLEFNTTAKKYTILVNGTDKKYWDGTNPVANLTDAPATNLYTIDDYRLYALSGTTFKCCAKNVITDWTTVDDSASQAVTGMTGTGTAITAYNDMVIFWSDQTMHILYGNEPGLTGDFEFSDPISTGCISNRSVIIHEGILYFMDYGKFKIFPGGFPVDISLKVKNYLENINYTYKNKIVAGKWGKYIYLSIPYGSTATTNNLTLEYDTDLGNWYPWNIGFLDFYNMGEDLYGVDSSGVVWKLQQGTADDSTAISWEAQFGAWDGTPVRQRKFVSDIWSVLDLPTGSTLTVYYSTSVDNDDWTSLYSFTANSSKQNTRIQIPTSTLNNLTWYRIKLAGTGACTVYFLEPHIRINPI